MALLKTCCCCSLLQGSIVTGVYIAVVYLAAFVMELALVLEGENWVNSGKDKGPLPLPGYILVVLHFTVVGLSVIMLYALYQRRVGVLLVWVFIMTLLFFPELGIVIFMVLFHWGLTSSYGLAEIVFYLVRGPFNVMCLVCVHSLYAYWKEQLATERSLKKLSDLQSVRDTKSKQLSYKNKGYLESSEDVSGRSTPTLSSGSPYNGPLIPYNNNLSPSEKFASVKGSLPYRYGSLTDVNNCGTSLSRRFSTLSQYASYRDLYQRPQMGVEMPFPHYTVELPSWDPYGTIHKDSRSEFNAALLSPYMGMGSTPILTHSRSEQMVFQNPRFAFAFNPNNYNYYALSATSRGLLDPEFSMGYGRSPSTEYSTQSLDRRRLIRRSHSLSMDAYPFQRGVTGTPFQPVYYGYPRLQESKSSIGAESDDFRKYRDVAL